MIRRITFLAGALGLILILAVGPTFAALSLAERSTKTKGATTVTWDSSFQDLNYTLGDTITMAVNWDVDAGVATYNSFGLKRNGFTPKSKKDPAQGQLLSVSQSGNAVTATFKFTGLHLDRRRNVDIGNAHFKLYLTVDTDGNGVVDSVVGYGVNVHVEDPQ